MPSTDRPVPRVFAIPELFEQILDYVLADYDSAPPIRLAYVSSIWGDVILSKLWECQTSLVPLSMISGSRQGYYASKIRTLRLGDVSELDTHLRDLEGPLLNLTTLELGTCKASHRYPTLTRLETPGPTWLRKLLGLRVRKVKISCGVIREDTDLLHALPHVCPDLESLEIWIMRSSDLPEQLTELIEAVQGQLRCFKFHHNAYDGPDPMSEAEALLFLALARIPGLQSLKMPALVFTPEMADSLSRANITPTHFSNLQSFTGIVTLGNFGMIPRVLPHTLKALKLRVITITGPDFRSYRNSTNSLLQKLAAFRQLRYLKLQTEGLAAFFKADFETLATFHDLTRLTIVTGRGPYRLPETYIAPEVDDTVFAAMCENLPNLEQIRLEVKHSLTADSLLSLGLHCRRLRELSIVGCYDLIDAFDRAEGTSLWPSLERFMVHVE